MIHVTANQIIGVVLMTALVIVIDYLYRKD